MHPTSQHVRTARAVVMCQDPLLSEELCHLHPAVTRTTAEGITDLPVTDALVLLTGNPATHAGRRSNERGTAIYLSTTEADQDLWKRAMRLRVSAVLVGTNPTSLRLLAEQFSAHLGHAA